MNCQVGHRCWYRYSVASLAEINVRQHFLDKARRKKGVVTNGGGIEPPGPRVAAIGAVPMVLLPTSNPFRIEAGAFGVVVPAGRTRPPERQYDVGHGV